MPSSGPPPRDAPEDDWDQVERWTRRITRLAAIGVPSWLILLAAFNQDLTGNPGVAGLAMAPVLAPKLTRLPRRVWHATHLASYATFVPPAVHGAPAPLEERPG